MEQEKKKKLTTLLIRLKKINGVYLKCNEEQRGRLIESSKKTIQELMEFGYREDFLMSLLVAGGDFVESLGELESLGTEELTEVIFR